MITFTREEANRLLDTLAETIDAQQWEIDSHIKTYGEWYRPKRVEHMKNALNDTLRMIEIISHKLNTPHEPTIDGWPLWSGLPQPEPVAYIDVETRNLSWAKPTRWETPTVVKMDKVPLYTAPPKKEWVGFTAEEHQSAIWTDGSFGAGFLHAEKLLKEKNV